MTSFSERQDDIHEALQTIVADDDELITSWVICYEAAAGDETYFGYIHGPTGVLPWRARGMHGQALAYMDAEVVAAEIEGNSDFEPEEQNEDE